MLFLTVIILLGSASISCRMTQKTGTTVVADQKDSSQTNYPLEIHRRAIAIDMHADTTQRLLDEQIDISLRLPDGHFDNVRAIDGGLDAILFYLGRTGIVWRRRCRRDETRG